MDARISSIALIVKDKAEALGFYTEKVGFEKKTDYTNGGYRYVTVGPKGQDLELTLWQEGTPDPGASSGQLKAGMSPPIVMFVDDVRKTAAELKAHGVQFKAEPQEYPWGVSATFTDPDGNRFSINKLSQRGP
ncbi:MAG: VOC family protein [Nitrososphaerales archaeon]|jgi:catechol 2,3-dioxygenase-like lactoylglutathione lyase family enzyme